MKTQVISEIVTEYMTKDVTISDEEVEKYYNTNIANYTTKPSATANHILFKSNNEDIDLEEVVIGYASAELVYNAVQKGRPAGGF